MSQLPAVSPDPAPGPSPAAGSASSAPAGPALASATGPGETAAPPPPAPPSPARVQVIAREFSFTLSRPTVPAGEVIIEFLNRGQDAHNLNLAPASEESEATGTFASTEPEQHRDQTLIMRAGTYTLFCSLPGHRAAGMHTTLVVD
jgi:plastocyanin